MKIAVISIIRDAWGGSEEIWYHMAKEAFKDGHQVIHLSYEHPHTHPKMAELERLGLIRIQRPGWNPSTSPGFRFLRLILNYLRKQVNDPIKKLFSYNPDIILYNGTCYSIVAEKKLLKHLEKSKFKNLPFYIFGHLNNDLIRDITDTQAAFIVEAYRRSKKVFFASERNKETAERHLCTTIKNAEVLRNPVNISTIESIPFPPINEIIQFAMIGNLVTIHKGQDVMLQALAKWHRKNWKLNIYGSGPDAEYLKKLTHFLHLENQVAFHGTVKNIREIWQQNHVLLLPSHMEGMPLVIVEAMLCGRICIATDVGGIKEWIIDGENGFIAIAPTVHSLLQAMETAWNKKEVWPQMGNAAHQRASKLYNPQAGKTLLHRIIAQ